jgi:hypothetical protein
MLSWPYGAWQVKNQDTMNDKIDFGLIASNTGREYKIRAITSEIERVGIQNIAISDCLVNTDRDGLFVMRTLHEHYRNNRDLRYKIKVRCDLWGKPVQPGQRLEWKFGRKVRDPFGRKYTQQQIKDYTRRGELRQIEIWHNAVVDESGCITVGFEDAAILLSERGVHYESKQPITRMPERARAMSYDSYDKDSRKPVGTQHFWLYEEVPHEPEQNHIDIPAPTRRKYADK